MRVKCNINICENYMEGECVELQGIIIEFCDGIPTCMSFKLMENAYMCRCGHGYHYHINLIGKEDKCTLCDDCKKFERLL